MTTTILFSLAAMFATGQSMPTLAADFPSLAGATAWINSEPLAAENLRGHVVVIDFGTYTCINWRRQLPYVRAWAEKYKDQGLIVIGVHSPEFEFEKNLEDVRHAIDGMKLNFPIAVDSDHSIWRAFENQYWPALYFIDANGRVRHHQFGEGEYEQSERVIQKLLTEAGKRVPDDLAAADARGAEAAADWAHLKSPENYLGTERTEHFASPGDAVADKSSIYSHPPTLSRNEWSLSGAWTMRPSAAQSEKANAQLRYRFHARDVHVVMKPAVRGTSVRFRVTIDGNAPGDARGVDVDGQGIGTLDEPRMYQLIRQSGQIDDRTFEIEFLDAGAEVFAFTFG